MKFHFANIRKAIITGLGKIRQVFQPYVPQIISKISVPGPAQLIEERKQSVFVKTDSTMKNVSPGRIENIPDGLKDFVLGGDGINSVCKLLYPYSKELFRDLSLMNIENFDIMGSFENGNATDGLFVSFLFF